MGPTLENSSPSAGLFLTLIGCQFEKLTSQEWCEYRGQGIKLPKPFNSKSVSQNHSLMIKRYLGLMIIQPSQHIIYLWKKVINVTALMCS